MTASRSTSASPASPPPRRRPAGIRSWTPSRRCSTSENGDLTPPRIRLEDLRSVGALGPFRAVATLNAWGTDSLFLAERVAGGDRVAVRVLDVGANARDDSLLESLREHVVRVSTLSARCPAIACLHECGRAKAGGIYLALEHPEAPTLAEVLQREGQLDPDRAVRLTVRVAEALEAAHMLGFAHGGLMPRNIVLLREDESVKLTEFGVDWLRTRARGADVNGAGGSPYLAPEQRALGEATPQGDVYALGAILYETLTGRPPELQGRSQRRASIQPLGKLRPDVSRALERVVSRALEPDPERRYRDMTDLFNDLWSEINPFSGSKLAGHTVRGR